MEMLCFLGKLMGSAARAHNYLDLYLAPIVWKLIVRQEVTLDDIRDIDVNAANQLHWYRHRLERGHKPLTEEIFYSHDLHFCTLSKGGTLVELHPGGASVS